MRQRYLVCYDIVDDRKRSRVFRLLEGWGDWVQYSVFRCDLSARERVELIAALDPLIDHRSDQILLVDLGPCEGRGAECVTTLGRPYAAILRRAIVV